MNWPQLLALFGAGAGAGLINTVVGSGTLITFPTLLAFGVPAVTANVTNNIGLAPGSLSGVVAVRADLAGQRSRVIRFAIASLIGGVIGAVLLITLPSSAFDTIVPVLIGIGCVLVIVQPRLSRWVKARRERRGTTEAAADGSLVIWILVLLTGVYGGYFGAAQGVLLLGVLGIGLAETLPRINAVKNVLAGVVNGVAAIIFIVVAHVEWPSAVAIAVGAVIGAQIGGRVGRKLPPIVYRIVIVVVGVVAIVNLLVH